MVAMNLEKTKYKKITHFVKILRMLSKQLYDFESHVPNTKPEHIHKEEQTWK